MDINNTYRYFNTYIYIYILLYVYGDIMDP